MCQGSHGLRKFSSGKLRRTLREPPHTATGIPPYGDAIIGKGSTFCRELTGKCGRISLFRGKKCKKHGSFALFRGIPAPFTQETVVPTARTHKMIPDYIPNKFRLYSDDDKKHLILDGF